MNPEYASYENFTEKPEMMVSDSHFKCWKSGGYVRTGCGKLGAA
jgi:hypothetical protein